MKELVAVELLRPALKGCVVNPILVGVVPATMASAWVARCETGGTCGHRGGSRVRVAVVEVAPWTGTGGDGNEVTFAPVGVAGAVWWSSGTEVARGARGQVDRLVCGHGRVSEGVLFSDRDRTQGCVVGGRSGGGPDKRQDQIGRAVPIVILTPGDVGRRRSSSSRPP